ncbi:MAG TPA: hypothetical protein VI603_14250 [Saprospiraceae bacterium]|nr:hypothetical protein [Saprospiraceae bacterium]
MKKIFTLFLAALAGSSVIAQNERYIDEVFTDVVKIENQIYSVNVTVVTGAPAPDSLRFDLYLPAGDTCTLRPLAVVLHTGTFLPRGLFAPTGDKNDYANVRTCEMLAKRGYVAASIQYRKGWNPIAPSDIERRSTIINAAYRSIQDMYAFLRFMNITVINFGNPHKVDMNRVAIFGIGTGGFVGFNAAVLTQEEIYIDKFKNPVTGVPFIDTLLVGDLHGIKPGLINVPNHVGYSDDFHFAFGLDGAIGDSTWIADGNSVPLVAAGTVTHPTTPFGIDPVTGLLNCDLPVFAGAGTGTFVVNIAGTLCMMTKANELGVNDPLNKFAYDDPVSVALRVNPNAFGQEHTWAINLPGPQTGPWEYWDSTFWKTIPFPLNPLISIHDAAIATNPDMSLDKANRYIDTAMWYFAPRAYAALKLGEVVCSCDGIIPNLLVVNDFECQKNFSFGAGADRVMIMNNPYPDADNDSEKVGAYLDPPADPWAALCVNYDTPIDLSVYNQFELQIYTMTDIPVLCKLEGGASPGYETWLNTSNAQTWETLRADFSSQAAENHTRVCIFPNGGVDDPNETTYLLDNLHWEMTSRVFYPTVDALDVSPNPADNMLYIRNPGQAVHFRLVSTLGQFVRDQYAGGQDIVFMTMSDLHQGIYLLGAYDAKGKLIASARIMKK